MQQLQRVAIYARVSSEQQTGESTIASQLAALQARVSSDGQILPAEQCFVDTGTAAPRSSARPWSGCAT